MLLYISFNVCNIFSVVLSFIPDIGNLYFLFLLLNQYVGYYCCTITCPCINSLKTPTQFTDDFMGQKSEKSLGE